MVLGAGQLRVHLPCWDQSAHSSWWRAVAIRAMLNVSNTEVFAASVFSHAVSVLLALSSAVGLRRPKSRYNC